MATPGRALSRQAPVGLSYGGLRLGPGRAFNRLTPAWFLMVEPSIKPGSQMVSPGRAQSRQAPVGLSLSRPRPVSYRKPSRAFILQALAT